MAWETSDSSETLLIYSPIIKKVTRKVTVKIEILQYMAFKERKIYPFG